MKSRKLYALLTLLILTCTGAGAQELDRLDRMSASFFSFGNATHVDADGNYYVTGFFGGSMDFGGKSLNGAGLGDIFIARYDTSRKLQWVKIGTSEGWNGRRNIGTIIESTVLTLGEGSGGFRLVRPGSTTTYPLDVQDGKPAVIAVEFAPLEEGVMTGTLTIRTNDPDAREVTISLSDEGESILSVGAGVGASILEMMEIHPSPIRSGGELVLKLRAPAELRVELIDLSGWVIADLFSGRSGGSERIEIPTEGLHSGLYFCRVTIDGRENLVPVMVVR